MVTTLKIMNKVNEILAQLYPSCTLYIQQTPGDMERPSFLICLDTDRSEDSGRLSAMETTAVKIKYSAPVEGTVPEELKPVNVYDGIKSFFRKGYLNLEGRAIKNVLTRGGTEDNEIFLIVKFVYMEDRRSDEGEISYEMMGEVRETTNLRR